LRIVHPQDKKWGRAKKNENTMAEGRKKSSLFTFGKKALPGIRRKKGGGGKFFPGPPILPLKRDSRLLSDEMEN